MEFIKTVTSLITHNPTREYNRYLDNLTPQKLNRYFSESATHQLYNTGYPKLVDMCITATNDCPLPKDIVVTVHTVCPSCDNDVDTNYLCQTHWICGTCCYRDDIEYICRSTGCCNFLAIDMYRRYNGNINPVINHIVECSEFGFLSDPGAIEWATLYEEERREFDNAGMNRDVITNTNHEDNNCSPNADPKN